MQIDSKMHSNASKVVMQDFDSPTHVEDPLTDKKLKLFAQGEVPEEEIVSTH